MAAMSADEKAACLVDRLVYWLDPALVEPLAVDWAVKLVAVLAALLVGQLAVEMAVLLVDR